MLMRQFAYPCMLLTASLVSLPAQSAHAGPLIDWLFQRPAYGPAVPVGAPYPVTAGYAPTAAGYAPYSTGYAPYTPGYAPYTSGYSNYSGYSPYGVAYLHTAQAIARPPVTCQHNPAIHCQPMELTTAAIAPWWVRAATVI